MNASELLIRRMTVLDVPQVYALEIAAFPDAWSYQSFMDEMEKNPCARYLVAEREGEVIAFAGAWIVLEEGHITNIAVKEQERGQGVGEKVTQSLMRYAANLGARYLTLEVRKSNQAARKLYRKLGFMEMYTRIRYYEDNGEDALLMVCQDMPQAEEDFHEI